MRGGGTGNYHNPIADIADIGDITDMEQNSVSPSLFLPTLTIISTTIVTGFFSGIGLATGFFFTKKYIIPWLSSFEHSDK